MKVITNRHPTPFDVDDTLILTSKSLDYTKEIVNVPDPISGICKFNINDAMVRLLKEEHHRGSFVIVWSRGGYEWAEAVVKALGLEDYVDVVMEKPTVYFDDKDIHEWLPYRVFISADTKYKN